MWRRILLLALLAAAVTGLALSPSARTFVEGRVANNVGVLYSKGIGVRQDPAAAARWYGRAAERGSAAGQFNLGYALQKGIGVPTDEPSAAHWYRAAAEQGMAEAANNLAMLYANPSAGRGDLVRARVWLLIAIRNADRTLAASLRESLTALEHDMQPAEIDSSNRLFLSPDP